MTEQMKRSILKRIWSRFEGLIPVPYLVVRDQSRKNNVFLAQLQEAAVIIGDLKGRVDDLSKRNEVLQEQYQKAFMDLARSEGELSAFKACLDMAKGEVEYHKSLQDRLLVANGLQPVRIVPSPAPEEEEPAPAEGSERFGG